MLTKNVNHIQASTTQLLNNSTIQQFNSCHSKHLNLQNVKVELRIIIFKYDRFKTATDR